MGIVSKVSWSSHKFGDTEDNSHCHVMNVKKVGSMQWWMRSFWENWQFEIIAVTSVRQEHSSDEMSLYQISSVIHPAVRG